MKNSPLKNYGFTYKHDGKDFVFHICAGSEQEAISRAAAMGSAELFGELKSDMDSIQRGGLKALLEVVKQVDGRYMATITDPVNASFMVQAPNMVCPKEAAMRVVQLLTLQRSDPRTKYPIWDDLLGVNQETASSKESPSQQTDRTVPDQPLDTVSE